MTTAAIKDLTRMIEELPHARQIEVRQFVEGLLARSKRWSSEGSRPTSEALPLSEANRRMLDVLQSWKSEPLPPEEEHALDDFEAFQRRHLLRFVRLDESA